MQVSLWCVHVCVFVCVRVYVSVRARERTRICAPDLGGESKKPVGKQQPPKKKNMSSAVISTSTAGDHTSSTTALLGIMSAMPAEIEALVAKLGDSKCTTETIGRRDYHVGMLWGVPVVLVFSRWGKVAAATTAATLMAKFGVTEILFTGVAGGVSKHLRVGDVVVGSHYLQHDLDARPHFERYEVPLLEETRLPAPPHLCTRVLAAAKDFCATGVRKHVPAEARAAFNLEERQPRAEMGLVVSGDTFFSQTLAVDTLREAVPDALCVEMEGAALAQVCCEHNVPFCVVRTISDAADDGASASYKAFLPSVAPIYSLRILENVLRARDEER